MTSIFKALDSSVVLSVPAEFITCNIDEFSGYTGSIVVGEQSLQ